MSYPPTTPSTPPPTRSITPFYPNEQYTICPKILNKFLSKVESNSMQSNKLQSNILCKRKRDNIE